MFFLLVVSGCLKKWLNLTTMTVVKHEMSVGRIRKHELLSDLDVKFKKLEYCDFYFGQSVKKVQIVFYRFFTDKVKYFESFH